MDSTTTYLNDVIMPYYAGYLNKDTLIGVLNTEGEFLFASNCLSRLYGYTQAADLIHASQSHQLSPENQTNHEQFFLSRMSLCQRQAVPIDFLATWFNHYYYATFSPLYYPDNSFLGIEFVAEQFKIDWYMDMFVRLHGFSASAAEVNQAPLDIITNLTDLQHQVLFLTIAGKSQYDIGAFLGRSRNSIKDVLEALNHKFKVTSTHDLIMQAVARGIHRTLPASLQQYNDVLVHVFSDNALKLLRNYRQS